MGSAQHIRELTRIINTFGGQRAKYLFSQKRSSSKLGRLASHFVSSSEPNESKWAQELLAVQPASPSYVRLRSSLKRRLLDSLFHLQLRGSVLRKAIYRNLKITFMVKTLLLLGGRRVAMWLIPSALERARVFELTSDRIEFLIILRQNAALNGDKRNFERYSQELEEVLRLRNAELRVSYLGQSIDVESVARAAVSETVEKIAHDAVIEVRGLFDSYPTFNIGLGYYRIATLLAEIRGEHERCIRLTEQADRFFAKYPHLRSPTFDGEFALKRLASAVSIRHISSAKEAVELCTKYYPKGLNNWFIWKGFEFQLCMQMLEFQNADIILNEVATHERFASQPEQVTQKWLLYGYYLFVVQGILNGVETPEMQRAMRAILRQVPIYAKDKAGYNISLLVIRYLVLLWQGDFNTITDQSEALSQYLRRHLRTRRESALFCFLKALLLLEKHAFRLSEVNSKAGKLITQFQEKERDEIDETQIIPFSFLWSLIQKGIEHSMERRHAY